MSNSWKLYLQKLARKHGMCADNRAYLSACEDKKDAIRLYKQTIDWALEEQYPDIDFLRKEFSQCESEGVYIDHHFDGELLNDHQAYVFHNCTGTIRLDINLEKEIIPMCYFANNCNMTILGNDSHRLLPIQVPLYIFGKNNICSVNSDTFKTRIFNENLKEEVCYE